MTELAQAIRFAALCGLLAALAPVLYRIARLVIGCVLIGRAIRKLDGIGRSVVQAARETMRKAG